MTNIRWIGVILVVTGCGGFGFIHALSYRKAERSLQAILTLLEQLTCELHYRMTPLPEALRKAASVSGGQIGRMMRKVAEEMDRQIAPDAAPAPQHVQDKHFMRKHGPNAYYGQKG